MSETNGGSQPTTTTTDTSTSTIMDRPNNQALSQEEKSAKQGLKRHLKQKMRLKKYETRLHQAVTRDDHPVADRARDELRTYHQQLSDDPTSVVHQPYYACWKYQQQRLLVDEPPLVTHSRQWLVDHVYQPLVRHILIHQEEPTTKQVQTDHARILLKQMDQGTQTKIMFDNDLALLGYTRQKFMERAVLAVSSLDRALEEPPIIVSNGIDSIDEPFSSSWWKDRLVSIETIASIGCGPGCDALGVVAFLQQQQQQQQQQQWCDDSQTPTIPLKKIILMDYVMPQWKRLIVDALIPLVVPHYVCQIETASCDVRFPLSSSTSSTVNQSALLALESDSEQTTPLDFVVVSYLLTETRGKWKAFFQDLLELLPTNALVLLSEPTAWQLHLFLSYFSHRIQTHQWLDSSRDTPALQGLDNRMGPAVLLVCMR